MKTRQKIFNILTFVALFFLILIVNGLIPGIYLNELSSGFLNTANVECIKNQGFFSGYCQNYCLDSGFSFVIGLPHIYLSALLSKITGIGSLNGSILSSILFLLVSFYFTIEFLKKLGVDKTTALLSSTLWLVNPIVWGHANIPYLLESAAILPAMIYVDYSFFTNIDKSVTHKKTLWLSIILIFTKVFSLFMFGYTFILYNFAGALILCAFIWKNRWRKKFILGTGIFILANILAYLSYKLYIGFNPEYTVESISMFKAMSVDLITLFLQPQFFWFGNKLGLTSNFALLNLYGDGTNSNLNYLGYSLIIIFALSFKYIWKQKKYIRPLFISGIIALILSFGPVLKFNAKVSNTDNLSSKTAGINYKMENYSGIDLHTEFLYEKIPGINSMRATYRWIILFKFILVLTAAIFLSSLKRENKRILYYFLFFIIFLEMMPDLPMLNAKRKLGLNQYMLFNEEVVEPLKKYVYPNDKVFFLSKENDYLANFIAAKTNIKTYSCGGDKNLKIAMDSWPTIIKQLRKTGFVNDELLYSSFLNGILDKLIIPKINLRWDSYSWPPREIQEIDSFTNNNDKLKNVDQKYFQIIELKLDTFIDFTKKENVAKYKTSGWSGSLWSLGEQAIIDIPLVKAPDGDLEMKTKIEPLIKPGIINEQRLKIYINDRYLTEIIADKVGEYSALVPIKYLNSKNVSIKFEISNPATPKSLGINNDTRLLGIAVYSVRLSTKQSYD